MIRIERLNFSVGTFSLQDISLEVARGEYFVLLGPSGSGKTLLLECLCGLRRIDSGEINIDGVDVTAVEPRGRGVGYLPQDYALFPHLPVRYNVGFGLANLPALMTGAQRERIEHLLKMVDLAHLAGRLPANLSGGEKQRVALARALAIRPQLLLLDEPVSALDERTRDELCRQLKRLQRQSQTPTIHVCHNFGEMLAVADRVGVIHQGRIVQVGSPSEILERPKTAFVARFVQAGNLFPATSRLDGEWIRLTCRGGMEFRAPMADSNSPENLVGHVSNVPGTMESCPTNGNVTVMVRPENVRLQTGSPGNMPPGTTCLEGRVRHVTDLGEFVRITVDCGRGPELLVSLGKNEYRRANPQVGRSVQLAVAPQDVHVLRD